MILIWMRGLSDSRILAVEKYDFKMCNAGNCGTEEGRIVLMLKSFRIKVRKLLISPTESVGRILFRTAIIYTTDERTNIAAGLGRTGKSTRSTQHRGRSTKVTSPDWRIFPRRKTGGRSAAPPCRLMSSRRQSFYVRLSHLLHTMLLNTRKIMRK